MDVLKISDLGANLEAVMDRVVADHTAVLITRGQGEAVVMLSLADWNALESTRHLLAHPTIARRLAEALRQLGKARAP